MGNNNDKKRHNRYPITLSLSHTIHTDNVYLTNVNSRRGKKRSIHHIARNSYVAIVNHLEWYLFRAILEFHSDSLSHTYTQKCTRTFVFCLFVCSLAATNQIFMRLSNEKKKKSTRFSFVCVCVFHSYSIIFYSFFVWFAFAFCASRCRHVCSPCVQTTHITRTWLYNRCQISSIIKIYLLLYNFGRYHRPCIECVCFFFIISFHNSVHFCFIWFKTFAQFALLSSLTALEIHVVRVFILFSHLVHAHFYCKRSQSNTKCVNNIVYNKWTHILIWQTDESEK